MFQNIFNTMRMNRVPFVECILQNDCNKTKSVLIFSIEDYFHSTLTVIITIYSVINGII